MALLLTALLAAGCTDTSHPSAQRPSSAAKLGLIIPRTYTEACAQADGFCMPGDGGPIAKVLSRPLHFPDIAPGDRCPSSDLHPTTTPVSGAFMGQGLVQPLIAGPVTNGGRVRLGETDYRGWGALKVIWFSAPSYQGPFVVRGKRLDGPGPLYFGESPKRGPLVVPPGPTLNGFAGYRTAPDAAWVRHPGCYGWQVDGLTFSQTIVFRAVRHQRATR